MKHHLLIAEATRELNDYLSVAAREAGWEVTALDDPGGLLRRADSLLPTAIVLAADLAGNRGWSLVNQLKRHPVMRHLYLVLTGSGESIESVFVQHQRLATRADAYQPRPYEPAELITQLASRTEQPRQEFLARLYTIRERSAGPSSVRSAILWSLITGAGLAIGAAIYFLR